MHHLAKISFGKLENRPYHAECACSVAGDFSSNEEARNYLAMHVTRLQGINSADFVDETVTPLPVQEQAPAEEVLQPAVVEEPVKEESKSEKKKREKEEKAEAAG
jgi:hypothetical protein